MHWDPPCPGLATFHPSEKRELGSVCSACLRSRQSPPYDTQPFYPEGSCSFSDIQLTYFLSISWECTPLCVPTPNTGRVPNRCVRWARARLPTVPDSAARLLPGYATPIRGWILGLSWPLPTCRRAWLWPEGSVHSTWLQPTAKATCQLKGSQLTPCG